MAADPSIYIADGFNLTHTIPAGKAHGAVALEYRPATYTEFVQWQRAGSPEAAAKLAVELIVKHVITLNGELLVKERAATIRPVVLDKIIDVILRYEASEQGAADAKN